MIIENRNEEIKNKIFNLADIKKLAHLFKEEYDSSVLGKSEYSIKENKIELYFHLKCFGSLSFESDNEEVFADNSKMHTKAIKTVEMHFKEGTEKKIKLVIQHGEDYDQISKTFNNNSYLEVSGKNELWVNGMLSKLKDYLDSVPIQERGILNYDTAIFWGLAFVGGYFTVMAISLNMCRNDANYFLKDLCKREGFWASIFMFLFLSLIPGIFLAVGIHNRIEKIKYTVFPSIELLLGPEHLLVTAKKKKRILYTWTMIILPIIISIACNIITNQIH